jgi:hypothetical protein
MNAWSATFLAAALAAMPGCAMLGLGGNSEVNLSTSPAMPASEGSARFSVSKNDNTNIDLRVKHLAHPEKLTPPAGSYVVWIKANKDAAPQNIGALKVDDNLNGSLYSETPLHSFDLFVTAEGAGQVQQPTGQSLLWSSYSR